MKRTSWKTLILICLFFTIRPIFAMHSNDDVADWVNKILQETITVNYEQLKTEEKRKEVGKYYSGQAVTGLRNFFSEIIPLIIDNRITTDPTPMGPAVVTQTGTMYGVPFWEVTQTYDIPTIKKKIWFSVVVTENQNPPLIIQNISIQIRNR